MLPSARRGPPRYGRCPPVLAHSAAARLPRTPPDRASMSRCVASRVSRSSRSASVSMARPCRVLPLPLSGFQHLLRHACGCGRARVCGRVRPRNLLGERPSRQQNGHAARHPAATGARKRRVFPPPAPSRPHADAFRPSSANASSVSTSRTTARGDAGTPAPPRRVPA